MLNYVFAIPCSSTVRLSTVIMIHHSDVGNPIATGARAVTEIASLAGVKLMGNLGKQVIQAG